MTNEIGFKFKPTFSSIIDFFEVRGFDEKTNKVLTIVHQHNGGEFEDCIEKPYYDAAFEVGDYIPLCDCDDNGDVGTVATAANG